MTKPELEETIWRLRGKKTALGPNGVDGSILARASSALTATIRGTFDLCFKESDFPEEWKPGQVVLIPKPGKAKGNPLTYPPIVVLNKMDNLFKLIIAARAIAHLRGTGPDLAECQYGLCENRSTVGVLKRVEAIAERAVRSRKRTFAISLDISNFNCFPWGAIRAVQYWGDTIFRRACVD